ncbi:MAG: DUF6110 family protein [Synergistaceae bacterium]|jgi:hypothetical protein|nr:DUF6110 family protein [Synergistaceae bacterium]
MNYEKLLFFGAGFVVGVGAVYFINSKASKNLAVAIASKGLALKECAASGAERIKEKVDDVVAEAKYLNEQRKDHPVA